MRTFVRTAGNLSTAWFGTGSYTHARHEGAKMVVRNSKAEVQKLISVRE